jgi:hypothetical protein
MDTAVGLVETYLRVNGYFTVTEFPVIESFHGGDYRTVTDLDVLAFRFPGAGRLVPTRGGHKLEARILPPDSKLCSTGDGADMIIGEVKEGRAELNKAARDPLVLQTVLTRFGCCPPAHVPDIVKALLQKGHAQTHSGHRVRLVAFGSTAGNGSGPRHAVISLGHIAEFLNDYIRQYWDILHHADFKDPAFDFLVMLEKARQGMVPAGARRDFV